MIYNFSHQSHEHSTVVTQNRSRKMREILGIALDLACEGGLDNLTLHRLAERMNRSVAAVYRYFPSREAVISELQRLIATHIGLITTDAQTHIDKWASTRNGDEQDITLAKILIAGLVYDEYARQRPDELGLVTRYLSTPDHVLPERDAAHVFETAATILDALADLIAEAERYGALTSGVARDRAILLWAGLHGTINVLKVVTRGGWSPAPDLTQQMVITNMVGWGADRDRLTKLTDIITKGNFTRIDRSARDLLTTTQDNH